MTKPKNKTNKKTQNLDDSDDEIEEPKLGITKSQKKKLKNEKRIKKAEM